jgi:predicted flap endonuclease-1-like 5' DNA nuclease
VIERQKPAAVPAKADKSKRDDLKIVEGIGPKIEQLFHAEGVYTWAALAEIKPDWIRTMLQKAGPRFTMHNPETWPRQSSLAAQGKFKELQTLQDRLNAGRPE